MEKLFPEMIEGEGDNICLKDGNPMNCSVDNLVRRTNSQVQRGRHPGYLERRKSHRPIIGISPKGHKHYFYSIAQAVEYTGVSETSIHKYFTEGRKNRLGWTFKNINED